MERKKVKEFKSTISYIKINNNGALIVDKENRVYVYDSSFKLINGFKIKLPENRPEENTVSCDEEFNYLLLSVSGYPLTFWNIKEKKLLGKFEWHKGDVLSVEIGQNYFASGGIDGKIYLYSIELLKMVSKIAKHKDFISDIAFGEDKIYATGYDKAVLFVDSSSLRKTVRFLHLKKALKIENKNYLISASEFSDVIKWDRDTCDDTDRVDLYKKFRDFALYDNYIFVLTDSKVVLYDLKNEVLVNDSFFETDSQKIVVYKDRMYLVSRNILEEVCLTDEKELLDTVLSENYKKAYEMIALNPFLKKTKAYEKLEKLYIATIKKAMKYYEEGMKQKALELLKPFSAVLQKREEINKIITHYENILKFVKAFENRNFALFYQLANQFEMLKNTKYYMLAEKEWEERFEKAKQLASEGRVSEAKEILIDFIPVPQKLKLINLLLKEAGLFRLLKEKIANKDFKGFFAIIKEHPELKDTKEYKSVIEYGEKLYNIAVKALEEEKFKYVLKICTVLEDIEGYELKAKELLNKAQVSLEFLRLFNEDKNRAFELAEKYPFLKKLKVYRVYEEKWQKKLLNAEREAFKGKIKSALEELKEYEYIKTKKPRITSMIKSAYLNYIKHSKDKNAIEKYIKTFGRDEEINNFLKQG
ncbi:hypothetical protein C3L23_05610 [Nautilia sp. PV-1]|uniref:WD40 repeat domain-containing protein n=1 Tax=Nautilia sp. PV-1 TaxID=2579250 RepID=UPI000FDA4BD2|nr:WD40 repeat domain-containing protein [Nautilia sp. PV-1]AZV46767.1 hypothetical protein C3L23_05610 [Nautilia sp. PV-1]